MAFGHKNGATARILHSLEFGDMTGAEIAEELGGYEKTALHALLRALVNPTPTLPQRAHIVGWTDKHFGQRDYPRPIYSLGAGKNVPKPVRNKKLRQAKAKIKHLAKVKKLRSTNSVFSLGGLL